MNFGELAIFILLSVPGVQGIEKWEIEEEDKRVFKVVCYVYVYVYVIMLYFNGFKL